MITKFFFTYLAILSLLTILISLVPGHNGDMGYYVACIIEREQGSSDLFHKTAEVLKKELPAAEYPRHEERLMGSSFHILDYYRIKPVYIWLITLLHALGFSYIFSTLLPSLVSYFGIGLITYAWASKILRPWKAIVISSFIMIIYPTVILARLSSPDGLSNLVLLTALYLIYFEKHTFLSISLLLFSILIRMDNLVTVLVVLTSLRFWPDKTSSNRLSSSVLIISALTAIILTLCLNYFLESDFWWFRKATYLNTWRSYGRQVLLYVLTVSGSFLVAILLFSTIAWFSSRKLFVSKQKYFLLMLLLIFIARFLFFPSFEERFASAFYVCGILILAEAFTNFRDSDINAFAVKSGERRTQRRG